MQVSRGDNEPLSKQYDRVRQHAVDLCAPLAIDDYGVQPIADVSPPKWHLAHTSWFFETFLLKAHLPDYQAFDESFEVLFNSYYNGVGEQHPRTERGNLSRPTVDEVYAYRTYVDERMRELLAFDADLSSLVVLGLQHEQQHQELLLSDIKYILGTTPVHAPYQDSSVAVSERAVSDIELAIGPLPLEFHRVPGGVCEIGVAASSEQFFFDNETPRHKHWLEPFALANRLVNNEEYLRFVEDGGYKRSELWLSEGWAAVQAGRFGKEPAPLYWRLLDGQWFEYLLTGLTPLRLDASVAHVSFYEADAYARWAGKRLMSEVEWEVAAQAESLGSPFVQLSDSLWQWTSSAYLPYPGFKPLPGTLGEYNGKFMSGQMVLRGGSLATPVGHTRASYRNFFYPPDRWQFTGIRLAEDRA